MVKILRKLQEMLKIPAKLRDQVPVLMLVLRKIKALIKILVNPVQIPLKILNLKNNQEILNLEINLHLSKLVTTQILIPVNLDPLNLKIKKQMVINQMTKNQRTKNQMIQLIAQIKMMIPRTTQILKIPQIPRTIKMTIPMMILKIKVTRIRTQVMMMLRRKTKLPDLRLLELQKLLMKLVPLKP